MGVSPATTHCGKAARLMSGTGWQKKGMLKRGCPHFSLGGLTTRSGTRHTISYSTIPHSPHSRRVLDVHVHSTGS